VLFCFSDFQVVTGDGEVQHCYLQNWRHDGRSFRDMFGDPQRFARCDVYVGDLYGWQLTGLYVLANTLVVRRADAGGALHFAEDLATYEDVECFIRLSRQGMAAYFDIETARQTDRAAGRLSSLSLIVKLRCHLAILERQYGRDAGFLAVHRALYERTIQRMQAQLLRLQISRGDPVGARDTLAAMHEAPLHLWLLLHLPDPWIGRALDGYRRAHRTAMPWIREWPASRALDDPARRSL
jgi:hypothetical protein